MTQFSVASSDFIFDFVNFLISFVIRLAEVNSLVSFVKLLLQFCSFAFCVLVHLKKFCLKFLVNFVTRIIDSFKTFFTIYKFDYSFSVKLSNRFCQITPV